MELRNDARLIDRVLVTSGWCNCWLPPATAALILFDPCTCVALCLRVCVCASLSNTMVHHFMFNVRQKKAENSRELMSSTHWKSRGLEKV